jgi:hypothetical protein
VRVVLLEVPSTTWGLEVEGLWEVGRGTEGIVMIRCMKAWW